MTRSSKAYGVGGLFWPRLRRYETEIIIAAGQTRRNRVNGWRGYSVRLEGAKYGVSFGSALAIAISYTNNHSILWAIIHGIFSWLYVVYFALVYG